MLLSSRASDRMSMPSHRGPISEQLIDAILGSPVDWEQFADAVRCAVAGGQVRSSEDLQLTLCVMYELHYRGVEGVSDWWEWNSELIAVRELIENQFEHELRELADSVPVPLGAAVPETLFAMTAPTSAPGLSRFMASQATREQFEELLIHRSMYQLKEADPHTWAIPRLAGAPKAALVEVQCDEYGGGRPESMHATLFADTMRAFGLDSRYGALVDRVPAVVLAASNAMSLFGLHRRLLGAIVGHLAAVEMTSSLPSRLYSNGLRRLGFGSEATLFFDEHIQADAVHEQIAGRDLAGGLAQQRPELTADILFGAAACIALDAQVGDYLLDCWAGNRCSLRMPLSERAFGDDSRLPSGAADAEAQQFRRS